MSQRARNRRLAVGLGLAAVAVYGGFVLARMLERLG